MAGIIETLDRIATFALVVEKIPGIGKVLKNFAEKGGDKLGTALGLDPAAADKTTDDESMFEKAVVDGTLIPLEKKSVMEYLGRLRRTNPKLAKEWVRWTHNTLVRFGRQVKLSSGPKDNREERTFVDYSDGIKIVENLFRDLISAPNDSARETVLTQRDIRVPEKKDPPGMKVARKVAETQKANFAEVSSFAKTAESNAQKRLQDALAKRRGK